MLHDLLPGYSGMSVHSQHFGYQVFDLRVDVGFELDFDSFDVVVKVLNITTSPGCLPMQHLVENYPHTPYITAVTELLPGQYLRCSIERSAKTRQFLGFGGIVDNPAKTEVTKFGDPLLEENVSRLNIPVDDLMLQELEISTHNMPHKGFRLVLADAFGGSVLVKVLLEITVLAELQNDVEVLSTSEAVIHLDNKGRGDGFEGSDLTFDLLLNMVGQFIDIDDFDSHLLPVLALPEIDRPACPLPQ